ncbi:hypothetical protein EDB84DRAFT_1434121 [Lactarius hengduanensis]|nr:hypothetical protein EDB84DRAFT_1434121 [Lactarius hengduanensis]
MGCRIQVCGDSGRIGVEGIRPRASAARSGMETRSVGCVWSETVVQVSARRENSQRWPPWSGTRQGRVAKAARKCSALGNARARRVIVFEPLDGDPAPVLEDPGEGDGNEDSDEPGKA